MGHQMRKSHIPDKHSHAREQAHTAACVLRERESSETETDQPQSQDNDPTTATKRLYTFSWWAYLRAYQDLQKIL